MSVLSKLSRGYKAVMRPLTRVKLSDSMSESREIHNVSIRSVRPTRPLEFNEAILYNIRLLESDNDVINVLAENVIVSYVEGPQTDGWYSYDYIRFYGKDEFEAKEVARKVEALHNWRASEPILRSNMAFPPDAYPEEEGNAADEPSSLPNAIELYNITVLESDKEVIVAFVGEVFTVDHYWAGSPERGGKYYYEHIRLYGEFKDDVIEVADKIKALHLQRATDSRERAIALIAGLDL